MSSYFSPEYILLATALMLLVLPRSIGKIIMVLGPAISVASVFMLNVDKLAFMFSLIFALCAFVCGIYGLNTKDKYETVCEASYAASAIGVVLASDWMTMIVFWEIMAISSWLVVVSGRTKEAAKAGFRYLLIHLLGGNLLLIGIVIKTMQGSTMIENLVGQEDMAYWLILLGVAVNTAIPPFNGWIGDAYPESTIAGTVYLGSYTTKVGIYCLIRIFAGADLLLAVGVIMALFGACMALIENDLRRLFSYHIISQLGYMVVALAIGSEVGIDGAAAHSFNNIIYKGTLLMCAGAVICATGKRKISDLGGLYRKMPLTAICFLVASLAIAGFPLFNGFVSKGLVMNAIAESGHHVVEILMMFASIGTLMSITLKVNYFVFFGKTTKDVKVDNSKVPFNMKLAMVIGAAFCIITGVFPSILYGLDPYGVDGHAYTVDHITQYVQLFAGGIIAFVMYLEHMEPHRRITLDTDWLYRKPLKWLVMNCSNLVTSAFEHCGNMAARAVALGNEVLHNPEILIGERTRLIERKGGLEEDDVLSKPAGFLVAINVVLFLVIVTVAVICFK